MDKDQIDDMLKFAEKESKPRGSDLKKRYDDKPRFFHSREKTLYIGGAIVLVIIIVVTFLSSGASDLSKADFNALMTRVDRIEVRLANMGGIEEKMTAALQAQKKTLSEGSTAGFRHRRDDGAAARFACPESGASATADGLHCRKSSGQKN